MGCETAVRQIMRTILSVDSKTKVKDAARMMVERGVGSLVANRDGLPFGILTERDLVERIVAEAADPSRMTVGEVMTVPLTTIDPSASLADAARKMVEKQIERLIVAEHGNIVGIVSQTDLVQSLVDLQKLAKLGIT